MLESLFIKVAVDTYFENHLRTAVSAFGSMTQAGQNSTQAEDFRLKVLCPVG